MHGRISVIIHAEGALAEQVVRAVRSLRRQTLGDWEGILLGEPAPGASNLVLDTLPATEPRLRWHEGDARGHDALFAALGASNGSRVIVLDPNDELRPGALEALWDASNGTDGFALARYSYKSRIGLVPGEPMGDLPGRVALRDWLSRKLTPVSFQLTDRRALVESLERLGSSSTPGGAWAWSIALDLAGRGATWGVTEREVGRAHLRALAPLDRTLRMLVEHIGIVGEAWSRHDPDDASGREAAEQPWIDAFTSLMAFEEQLRAEGPTATLDQGVRFGNLFATWWQRLDFAGPAPLHVLEAQGGTNQAFGASLTLRAERLVGELDLNHPIELLGLGRNARYLARALHAKGLRVRGRDDALNHPPAWSSEDGIDVDLLERGAPFDRRAQHVMTVSNDAGFLERLPEGLRLIRWNDAPRLLLDDAMRALTRGRLAEPKPSPDGVGRRVVA